MADAGHGQRSAHLAPGHLQAAVERLVGPGAGGEVGLELDRRASGASRRRASRRWTAKTLTTTVISAPSARDRSAAIRRLTTPPAEPRPVRRDNMAPPQRHFISAPQEIPVGPSITAHPIIAVQGGGPIQQGDDGVVEYASAHIGGVESELVVQPSSHSTQGNPRTIEEVRRILRLPAGLTGP